MTDPICPVCREPLGDTVYTRKQGVLVHAPCCHGSMANSVILESLHQRLAKLESSMAEVLPNLTPAAGCGDLAAERERAVMCCKCGDRLYGDEEHAAVVAERDEARARAEKLAGLLGEWQQEDSCCCTSQVTLRPRTKAALAEGK